MRSRRRRRPPPRAEPSISRSRSTRPTHGGGEVELALAVHVRELGGLAAEERHAGLPTDLGRSLDELGDLLEVEPGRGDVVEQEERVGARRDHVVDAVRGHVGAARAERSRAAARRSASCRSSPSRRRAAALVEREETGERAEPGRARRLDCGAQALPRRHRRSRGRLPRRRRCCSRVGMQPRLTGRSAPFGDPVAGAEVSDFRRTPAPGYRATGSNRSFASWRCPGTRVG